MRFDELVQEASTQGRQKKTPKPSLKTMVRDAMDGRDFPDILRTVLTEVGFESSGYDAMTDAEVTEFVRLSSRIKDYHRQVNKELDSAGLTPTLVAHIKEVGNDR